VAAGKAELMVVGDAGGEGKQADADAYAQVTVCRVHAIVPYGWLPPEG
jgi:hypothetical protein